ncbi:PREDICTED: transcription elongation factor 1 homolog [Rhagoletis zephyria]|uniref:transcription elongation factor 1 homolog n=1 Tax=Rhagoletis zephyria TaxID=28612 RepID=UPI00081165EC|nr:PREDICTED: transcription elongation factor 1 homolog [Rhagoletis zephyria]KAH9394885.1 Transcription elongation factor 1 [Tyrophagus putrescentiae]
MGGRKSKKKPMARKKLTQPLDVLFNCPFCNHEKSCEVNLCRPENIGHIFCHVCLEDFKTTINYLSEAIDVYAEWIDACENVNN